MYKDIINETFSQKPEVYRVGVNLNPDTGFFFRHVFGKTENFTVHTHEYYELTLTLSGNIIHCVNNDIQILEPGCLVFVRPGDIHRYIYRNEKKYEFINLAFSCEIAESLLSYLEGAADVKSFTEAKLPHIVRLTPRETQAFTKTADKFNTIDKNDFTAQKLSVRSFLLDIFIKYFLNRKSEARTDLPLWLELTCEKMQKPENFTAGIKRMVEISGKTQEHLARTLRKYCDISLSQYINELRLNYAVNLIVNTNLKITDICFEAGFGNISSFYTLFSEVYNMSPKKFRESKTDVK